MNKQKQTERDEARAELRKLVKPGQTIYTILRHCSASGMMRVIDLVIPLKRYDNEYPALPVELQTYPGQKDFDATPKKKFKGVYLRSIGYLAAKATESTWDRDRQGVKRGGCGMDMGFNLVYSLGNALWPNGTKKPHSTRNGEPDTNGGYALKHSWL